MNATEARALTDARREETYAQWYLRMVALPAIEAAAGSGYSQAECYTFALGWQIPMDQFERVGYVLEQMGYKVNVHNGTMLSNTYVMEVSW